MVKQMHKYMSGALMAVATVVTTTTPSLPGVDAFGVPDKSSRTTSSSFRTTASSSPLQASTVVPDGNKALGKHKTTASCKANIIIIKNNKKKDDDDAALLLLLLPDLSFLQQQRTTTSSPSSTSSATATAETTAATTAVTARSFLQNTPLASILSAAFLITSSTVGAGMLVLPELILTAQGGPSSSGISMSGGIGGMSTSSLALFGIAHFVNLLSGLLLSQVAITNHEQQQQEEEEARKSATCNSSSNEDQQQQLSFKELARANFHSDTVANMISIVSMCVNMAICAFDIDRVGAVLSDFCLSTGIIGSSSSSSISAATLMPHQQAVISIVWAALFGTLLSTSSLSRLGQVASVCATALFVSFAGLLLPGLTAAAATAVATAAITTTTNPVEALSMMPTSDVAVAAATAAALDDWQMLTTTNGSSGGAVATLFPIMLMSLVFQNVVPAVTHMLSYNRIQTTMALVLGSAIPLCMYVAWCLVATTTTMTISTATAATTMMPAASISGEWLLTAFSLATLAGSTLGTGMSIAGELGTFLDAPPSSSSSSPLSTAAASAAAALDASTATATAAAAAATTTATDQLQQRQDSNSDNDSGHSSWALSALTLGLPLSLALTYGGDLTEILSLAGSLGSPLLYGVIPVAMAWNQQQQQQQSNEQQQQQQQQPALAAISVPALLGASGLAFVGQEVAQRIGHLVPI